MDKLKEIALFTEIMKGSSELILYNLAFYEEADIKLAMQYINLFIEYQNDLSMIEQEKFVNFMVTYKLTILKFRDYLKNILKRFLNSTLRISLNRSDFLKIIDLTNEFYLKLAKYENKIDVNENFEKLRIHDFYLNIIIHDCNYLCSNLDYYEDYLIKETTSFKTKSIHLYLKVKDLKKLYFLDLNLDNNIMDDMNQEIDYLIFDFIKFITNLKEGVTTNKILVNKRLSILYLDNLINLVKYYHDLFMDESLHK